MIYKTFPEAKSSWISDITAENSGNLIKTEGRIISADNVNPIVIKKVYICNVCGRLHKITEKDNQNEIPKWCIKCEGSLKLSEFRLYDDYQLFNLEDIFDSKRSQIYASTIGDNAFFGKFKEGDYVNIIAKVDIIRIKNRNRVILKIEEIKNKNITIIPEIAKKIWKTKPLTEAQIARKDKKYIPWRMAVLERDYFTCQKCKQYLNKLEAHHIYNFSDHIHLRYEVENGITLCEKCHNNFHRIYGKQYNNKYQLDEFLRINQYIDS